MSRHGRRLEAARNRTREASSSSRGTTNIESFSIEFPFLEGQRQIIQQAGYRSLEAYRALLFSLRFNGGATGLLQTSMDYRIGMPVPPTAWFVEKEVWHGVRNMELDAVEKARIHKRTSGESVNGVPTMPSPGSVLVYLPKNEHGPGYQVEYLFEHNDLDHMERYTYCRPSQWRAYRRDKATDPWVEVPIEAGDVP